MDVREKLVELLVEFVEVDVWDNGEFIEKDIDFGRIAENLISHGVTVQEWISVKDRLPENNGQYLIFTTQYFTPDHIDEIDHSDGIEISGYHKGYGFLSTNGMYAKYWCRLPQPPKGE